MKIAKAQEWRKARCMGSALPSPQSGSPNPRKLRTKEQVRQHYQESNVNHYDSDDGSSGSGSKRSRGNNVMKNYARAMVRFALSELADPYLERMKGKYSMSAETFKNTLLSFKSKVNCIKHLRDILLVSEKDSEEMKIFKRIFQELCVVFMKYFSVNWIYHGKMNEKSKYLHYRGKMLRRVQDPVHFTYLESFVEKKTSKKDLYGRRLH